MRPFFILLITLSVFSCTTEENIDISKYPMVTTISELADYYYISVDTTGRYEKSNVIKYFDGSFELDYTYELIETEDYDPLYYSITIEREPSVKDAREMFVIGKGSLSLVGNAMGQGTIEIDSLDLPGDQNYYAFRTYEDELNGMFFIVRKGTCIYTVIVSGLYTLDHSLVTDLVLPKLDQLESFALASE